MEPTSGWADPHLQEGQDFMAVDLGNGNVLALCPACYAAARDSILADAQNAGPGGSPGEGEDDVNWNKVNWNKVNWNKVNWNKVNWNKVNWNKVNWNK